MANYSLGFVMTQTNPKSNITLKQYISYFILDRGGQMSLQEIALEFETLFWHPGNSSCSGYLHMIKPDCVRWKHNKRYLRVSAFQIHILTCMQQDRWGHLHAGPGKWVLNFYRDEMTCMNCEQERFCAFVGLSHSPSVSGGETNPEVNFLFTGIRQGFIYTKLPAIFLQFH